DQDAENWVVFDMDIKLDNKVQQKEDYENAIQLAESKGINVAYSNDAFELWFLLHYQFFDNQWTRYQYYQKLGEIWNCNYEKMGKQLAFCKQIYKRLKEDNQASQTDAILRAKKLKGQQLEIRLADQNPITTVHLLVTSLNEHL
ncbi:MAG: RloB family protein, partial [Bacteroidota bacterium]